MQERKVKRGKIKIYGGRKRTLNGRENLFQTIKLKRNPERRETRITG